MRHAKRKLLWFSDALQSLCALPSTACHTQHLTLPSLPQAQQLKLQNMQEELGMLRTLKGRLEEARQSPEKLQEGDFVAAVIREVSSWIGFFGH